jgi:hypothetical protein
MQDGVQLGRLHVDSPGLGLTLDRRPRHERALRPRETLVDAILEALGKGKHEITFPRFIAAGYVVRAIAPGFMRRTTKRQTLEALAKQGR